MGLSSRPSCVSCKSILDTLTVAAHQLFNSPLKANALPATAHKPLEARDYLGLALYVSSFVFEVIAGIIPSRGFGAAVLLFLELNPRCQQMVRSLLGARQRMRESMNSNLSQADSGLSVDTPSEPRSQFLHYCDLWDIHGNSVGWFTGN